LSAFESSPNSSDTPEQGSFTIRPAVADDAATIAGLVHELAVYEKLEHLAKGTPEDFRKHLFGPRPHAEALIAEVDGQPVGLALFFPTFSTFRGQPGMHLEDVFVQPAHQGKGIGKALLKSLARIARDRGYGRIEWAVLDWNAPAIAFYQSLGAGPLDEWITYRIADEPLERLAEATAQTESNGS